MMKEIFIKYNPYKVETEIKIQGEDLKQNTLFDVEDKRLQEWVEDLPENLKEECNSDEFKIIFHGTVLDYEDLCSVCENAKNVKIVCEHIPAKEVADKEEEIAQIFEDIKVGPFNEFRDAELIKSFESARNSEFPVNVIATMSAGKSTLINALLGQKLMPASQEACTATITEIKDVDGLEGFEAVAYNSEGDSIEFVTDLTLQEMARLNKNENVSTIKAEGDINFVKSNEISLVLVDTPGPNNSRDQAHKEATYRMLSNSSKTLVLYIMNATQLAVNDDNSLLSYVAESMKVNGKQSKDRFIFVVNKLDEFKKGEDSVEASIEKVKEYLEEKGIKNPNIFGASALTALDIRTILKDQKVYGYSEDELDDMCPSLGNIIQKVKYINRNKDIHLEKYAPLTPSAKEKINVEIDDANAMFNSQNSAEKSEGAKKLALIHSGIIPIEMAIETYVDKYAKTAKIKNVMDTFTKKIESTKAFDKKRKEIAQNKGKQNEVLAQINLIQSKINQGEDAKKFKAKINSLNYDTKIKEVSKKPISEAQKEIEQKIKDNSYDLTMDAVASITKQFVRFTEDLQSKTKVRMEELIEGTLVGQATDLLNMYKEKLADLTAELDVSEIKINPFELMDGDISIDIDSLIKKNKDSREEEDGTKMVKNENKKIWKPWTWFQPKEIEVTKYKTVDYVKGEDFTRQFFAPLQKQLLLNRTESENYAKQQVTAIKHQFSKKFDELDGILQRKMDELKLCASDNEQIENTIKEIESNLAWLENIQRRINNILDI